MGAEVKKIVLDGYRGASLCAGVDINPVSIGEAPVYTSWSDVKETPDCIIDFSHHSATESMLEYAVKNGICTVIATTGHDEREMDVIRKASEQIPVFHSANMSLGIALLCELAKQTARTFPDADIEIIEKHHNRKLDAPSGTALMIARSIENARGETKFVYGRQGQQKREKGEVGIHAVRAGNIVGEHEVIVATDTQIITLKHEAQSRALFAEGALAAAEFINGKPAGLYTMKDIAGA
jgi:4-hydroxy-tetrahydrodipicolinate reductase